MENKLDILFKKKKNGIFASFLMSGYPDSGTFLGGINALIEAGVDIIEVGIPFSDPAADGEVIQNAGKIALQNGVTIETTLRDVSNIKQKPAIVLMGYYNPIYKYGEDKFILDVVKSGVDGIIIVDLPFEEAEKFSKKCKNNGIHFIQLVTQLTDEDRMKKMAKSASGFVYFISVLGITGTKTIDTIQIQENISKAKDIFNLPVLVGFGISTPEQASQAAKLGNGVVVGSHFIKILAKKDLSTLMVEAKRFLTAIL